MQFNYGDRVQLKNVPSQPWFEQDKQYSGTVIGNEDSNVVVRLDRPVVVISDLVHEFSFQPGCLEQVGSKRQPVADALLSEEF